MRGLLGDLGIAVNVVAPLGATPADLGRLGQAAFNVVLYPEVARSAAQWLEKAHGQPFVEIAPIGVKGTTAFIEAVAALAGIDPAPVLGRKARACPGTRARSIRPI